MKKRWIYPTSSLIIFVGIWEILGRLLKVPAYILPVPTQIFQSLITEFNVLLTHSLVTLTEALIGLVLAAILALVIGIAMDACQPVKWAIYPHLVISQTIPILVLGPIFSIWFGFGMTPKILMVVLMCFFPISVAFTDGLKNVNQKKITLLKTYGASTRQIYQRVKIPEAFPAFLSGLKISATYCIGGAIVGEWLSASAGLGYYMIRAKNGYLLDNVFASIIMIMTLSLLLNASVSLIHYILIKKRMIPNEKN